MEFHEKFAIDEDDAGVGTFARKLTADGCFARHDEPRSSKETIMPMRNESLFSNRQEQRLQQDVFQLIAVGLQPDLEETLEEFVIKHADMLE